MIISDIIIKNFRCYAGTNKVSFNTDQKINIFYGLSGYGKSTFLQFIMWMLYDDPNFGAHNDKPLFNESVFASKKPGDVIEVFGQMDFEHLGVRYSLNKTEKYKVTISESNTSLTSRDKELKSLVDDNWVIYGGDISNKINSFLPKGLSKYFLLDGERARELVLNAKDLRIAIQSLFGLNAYSNAIMHIGSKSRKNSVLGYYYSQMTSKMPKKTASNSSAAECQEHLQLLDDKIEGFRNKRKETIERIYSLSEKRDELIGALGKASNKKYLEDVINKNKLLIENDERTISDKKHQLGDLFYKNYPYLLLAELTTNSSAVLKEKYAQLSQEEQVVFDNLKKDLLKEILDKGICVCGRKVDDNTYKKIDSIINTMPPDSYTYQFGQFVSKSKAQISRSRIESFEYDNISMDIAKLENEINSINSSNEENIAEFKKMDQLKPLVAELESINADLKMLDANKTRYESEIATNKKLYDLVNQSLESLVKTNEVYREFRERIEFFENLKAAYEADYARKEREIKSILNQCVRDVFKEITTQRNLDVDEIEFINDDFSLRTTFLTGGQQAIDVYAYVLGIIRALEEYNPDSAKYETPVIIDAPFAFTDDIQSEHIFSMLPQIAKQAIVFTLDINKIRNGLSKNPDMYEFSVIDNETCISATIRKGDINDIKY